MVAAKSRTTKGKGRLWGHSLHLASSSLPDTELPSRLFQALAWAVLKPEGLEGRPVVAALREGICSDSSGVQSSGEIQRPGTCCAPATGPPKLGASCRRGIRLTSWGHAAFPSCSHNSGPLLTFVPCLLPTGVDTQQVLSQLQGPSTSSFPVTMAPFSSQTLLSIESLSCPARGAGETSLLGNNRPFLSAV